jgi:glycosyltransferase involved in cell wall biosynthesis
MKKLARAGFCRIEAEFSWDTIAKRTEKVYELVLGPRSS